MAWLFGRAKKDDKQAAEECYTKGQWAQALEAYERLVERDAGNVKLLRRVADLRAKLGRVEAAVETYREVADLYAANGFLVQGIAIYKILKRLDPTAADVGRKLADLYAKRGLPARASKAEPERHDLPEIPLFSDLDAEAFGGVVERLVPRSLGAGEFLFREGDPGDSIFIVTAGSVRVSRGEMQLAELGEGTFFGEGAFFSHEARNADVAATDAVELLEIRREDMEDLMSRYPGVAAGLTEFYRRRVLDGMLAGSELFGGLPEELRRSLADRLELCTVSEGEVVIREGERDRCLYLVKRGRFRVSTVPPGAQAAVTLSEFGAGSVFGEVALISDAPRTATVTALEEGELLRADEAVLSPVLDAHPGLRTKLEALRERRADATVATLLGRKG